jgi:PAS domain S-box-containing protein
MLAMPSTSADAILNALLPRDASPADLLERVAEGVLVADGAGHIVYAHPSAARALRQTPSELHGQSSAALRHWLCPDPSGQPGAPGALLFTRALQGETVEAEYRVTSSDHQEWWIRWSEAPLRDASGAIQGVVAWAQKVTPYQQHVAGAAPPPVPVADAHAECRESLATISHDLKNPLTRIKGVAQLLQRRLANGRDLNPVQFRESLAQIDRTVGQMTMALNELLETAHLPAGQSAALDRRPTDLVAVVRHLVEEYQQATERHEIHLQTTQSELFGTWDASRIERAVANLLSNAVKYSPEGGQIHVILEQVEPEGWALLQVRDQGIGIPAIDLPHVFEGAHRAGNVVGRITGTGMGLLAVRQTVEQHGGTIAVSSEEGRGTTVTVWLPLHRDTADPATRGGGNTRDDHPAAGVLPASTRSSACRFRS